MAERPIFLPQESGPRLVKETKVPFTWFPGLAVSQKQKSVASLHDAARRILKVAAPLEVSSKSTSSSGRALSAFVLKVKYGAKMIPLESAFQGSKVFESAGPFVELLDVDGRAAKMDPRIRNSGRVTGFRFEGTDWPTQPTTAFYDWLYLNALSLRPELLKIIKQHDAFTDIEFNPEKSINCQARSAAMAHALLARGKWDLVLSSKERFLDSARGFARVIGDGRQEDLF